MKNSIFSSLLIKFLVVAVMSIIFCNCSATSQQSQFAPSDFSVMLNIGGGMSLDAETFFISKDSCFYETSRGFRGDYGYENTYRFSLNTDELNSLYKAIMENDPADIETYSVEVFDRGGSRFTITQNGEKIEVSNSGMSFVKEGSQEQYDGITGAIEKITFKKLENQKRSVSIKIDESIRSLGMNVNIVIAMEHFMSGSGEVRKQIDFEVLNGVYYGKILIMNPKAEHENKVYSSGFFKIDTNDKLDYRLYLVDKTISIE